MKSRDCAKDMRDCCLERNCCDPCAKAPDCWNECELKGDVNKLVLGNVPTEAPKKEYVILQEQLYCLDQRLTQLMENRKMEASGIKKRIEMQDQEAKIAANKDRSLLISKIKMEMQMEKDAIRRTKDLKKNIKKIDVQTKKFEKTIEALTKKRRSAQNSTNRKLDVLMTKENQVRIKREQAEATLTTLDLLQKQKLLQKNLKQKQLLKLESGMPEEPEPCEEIFEIPPPPLPCIDPYRDIYNIQCLDKYHDPCMPCVPSNPCMPCDPSNLCIPCPPTDPCISRMPSNPCISRIPSNPCIPCPPIDPFIACIQSNPRAPSNPCFPSVPSNPCIPNNQYNPCIPNNSLCPTNTYDACHRLYSAAACDMKRSNCSLNACSTNSPYVASFNLITVLAKGTFTEVALVKSSLTSNKYIIKSIIKKDNISKICRMKTVFAILTEHKHPFVVNMHDVIQDDDRVFFVMEYLCNGNLKEHLKRFTVLEENEVVFFASCALLGIDHLHSLDIAHRDIKLDNLVLDSCGYAKIVDLDLAIPYVMYNTPLYDKSGTSIYKAPEFFKSCEFTTRGADFWALGVVIHALLTAKCINTKPCLRLAEEKLSPVAEDLLVNMLHLIPNQRLGNSADGGQMIMKHPFFKDMDWTALCQRKVSPPKRFLDKFWADYSDIEKRSKSRQQR